jgi:hypothetical protein
MESPQHDDSSNAVQLPLNPWEDPAFDAPVRTGSASRFQENTWEQPVNVLTIRPSDVRISFDADLGSGERLTDPHLRELLWAAKCFVWSLIHSGGRGKGAPRTVRQNWNDVLALLKWMRQYSYGSFGELSADAILDYIYHVQELRATPLARALRLKILRDPYLHQERLPDGLRLAVHPFGGDTDPQRFFKAARQKLQGIPAIPDEVIIPVVMEARRWLEQYPADVIRLTEEAEAVGATYGAAHYWQKTKKRAARSLFSPF